MNAYIQVRFSNFQRQYQLSLFKDIKTKSNKAGSVEIQFLPANKFVTAKIGDSLADVAKGAGIEINYKCMKGECGTCEINVNGKWIKACQSTVPPLSDGAEFINIMGTVIHAKSYFSILLAKV